MSDLYQDDYLGDTDSIIPERPFKDSTIPESNWELSSQQTPTNPPAYTDDASSQVPRTDEDFSFDDVKQGFQAATQEIKYQFTDENSGLRTGWRSAIAAMKQQINDPESEFNKGVREAKRQLTDPESEFRKGVQTAGNNIKTGTQNLINSMTNNDDDLADNGI